MHEPTLTASSLPARLDGLVLFLHGGRQVGDAPVERRHASYWRIVALQRAVGRDLRRVGIGSYVLRYRVRGWNEGAGRVPDPVLDARWALDRIAAAHPGVSVALTGHSMGGRTALAVADRSDVVGVCALAPWWPPEEPIDHLGGRPLVVMHGDHDRVTSAAASRDLTERAALAGARTSFTLHRGAGHYLVRGMRTWNEFVGDSCRGLLGVQPWADRLAASMTP